MLSYYYLFYTIIMPTHHISPPNRTIESNNLLTLHC